jgi:hypothetical protein
MKQKSVIDRTKHDKMTPEKGLKLADHPAMKELSRMVESGEVDAGRTLEHLKRRGVR